MVKLPMTRVRWTTSISAVQDWARDLLLKLRKAQKEDVALQWKTAALAYVKHPPLQRNTKIEQRWENLDGFVNMSTAQQLSVINDIWKSITIPVKANKVAEKMSEPVVTKDRGAFRTSEKSPFAWQQYTIGFRCDSRPPADVAKWGFKPLYWMHPLAEKMDHHVRRTIMASHDYMYIFRDNRDAVGETCVCVARTFFGATKFPDKQSVTGGGKRFHVWALDMKNSVGFDLEEWQARQGEPSLWRPGEKMFYEVPPSRLIAHVEVNKLGGVGGGWSFEILKSCKWSFHRTLASTSDVVRYLQQELDAYRGKGRVEVTQDMDFIS